MSLNTRIKERREQLGMTRQELADCIGVTPSAIANYENGVSSPKIEILYKIFYALKCDANYLYHDEMVEISKKDHDLYTSEEKDLIARYRIATADTKMTVHHVFKMDEQIRTLKNELYRKK